MDSSEQFEMISSAACQSFPGWRSLPFDVKAVIYIEHYELKHHHGDMLRYSRSCPWCNALKLLLLHEPERENQEVIDLTNE